MLTGDKVTLRPVRPDDLPVLYEIYANLDNWEERNATPPAPVSRAAYDERQTGGGTGVAARFAVTVDGQVIGSCALMDEDTLARNAAVSISLTVDATGQGYGSDALRVLVDYAFTRRNLRRLHLSVIATNERAIGAYRKVGFVEEGRRREHCWVRGGYVDEVIMGLLRSDRRATPG